MEAILVSIPQLFAFGYWLDPEAELFLLQEFAVEGPRRVPGPDRRLSRAGLSSP